MERSGTSGIFLISETAIEMESEPNYYYLLVGTLNSEFENDRSYVELYGFTEVLPGRITTDRIVSSDGLNFFDFVKNSFRIGNEDSAIEWNLIKNLLQIVNATLEIKKTEDGTLITVARIDGQDGSALFGKGAHLFNADGSLSLANNNIIWNLLNGLIVTGKYQSALSGRRFVIDPNRVNLSMYTDDDALNLEIQADPSGSTAINMYDGNPRFLRTRIDVNSVRLFDSDPSRGRDIFISPDATIFNCPLYLRHERLSLVNIPTSPNNLALGEVWNDNGTLKIV